MGCRRADDDKYVGRLDAVYRPGLAKERGGSRAPDSYVDARSARPESSCSSCRRVASRTPSGPVVRRGSARSVVRIPDLRVAADRLRPARARLVDAAPPPARAAVGRSPARPTRSTRSVAGSRTTTCTAIAPASSWSPSRGTTGRPGAMCRSGTIGWSRSAVRTPPASPGGSHVRSAPHGLIEQLAELRRRGRA